MSIGVKITVKQNIYEKIKKCLSDNMVEHFSHDVNPDRYETFIISGITRTSTDEVKMELQNLKLKPVEVREINPRTKRFDAEGVYSMSFKYGSATLTKLQQTKIFNTIPKWRLFVKSKNRITPCWNCQMYGHGQRNCSVKPKCSKCGESHQLVDCKSDSDKCANCQGNHPSTHPDCAKRKNFIEMRNKLSSQSNHKSKSKPAPPPRLDARNFPQLNRKLDSPIIFPELPSSTAKGGTMGNFSLRFPTRMTFNNVVKEGNQKGQQASSKELFKPEEIKVVLEAVFNGLNKCQTREDQLSLMFELAAHYIYGQP